DAVLANVGHRLLEHTAAAFRTNTERCLPGEIHLLLRTLAGLAEVELCAEFRRQLDDGRERLAHAAAKALQRPAGAFGDQLFDLLRSEFAARHDLPDREIALLALEFPVVFLDLAAAFRAGRL